MAYSSTNRHWTFGFHVCEWQLRRCGRGGAIYRSTDAVEWIRGVSGTQDSLVSVASSSSAFVALGFRDMYFNGEVGDGGELGGTILRSTDAITWTKETSVISQSIYLPGAVTVRKRLIRGSWRLTKLGGRYPYLRRWAKLD
jgi:hypothetical protein